MATDEKKWCTPAVVMVAGCMIAIIGMGTRASLGLFLEPMSSSLSWSRETYALAMAIQNLLWGILLPFAGALTDRYGASWVISAGAVFYSLGLWGMSVADSVFMLHVSGGILMGLGSSFVAFNLAIAAMVKVVGPERRLFVMGVGTAATSVGQLIFSPMAQGLISNFGWSDALVYLSFISMLIISFAVLLPSNPEVQGEEATTQRLGEAVREAFSQRGFILLMIGFFACGFHVAFIGIHLPAYVTDLGLAPQVGAYCLALIGLFNIAGSFLSGMVGSRWSKTYGLSWIYFGRALVILGLLLAPKTALTLYVFSALMGLLWLSTIPLTTGVLTDVFGVRYVATLYGFVFFGHQVGSFIGVWLGGVLYDRYGSYDGMWWAGIVVGVLAALIHLPISEKPVSRVATANAIA
ncbi:MFS transporter [Gammaproteobacteria bacterium]|nr:MFS transporter [Gammaproteobacteria bacterium]